MLSVIIAIILVLRCARVCMWVGMVVIMGGLIVVMTVMRSVWLIMRMILSVCGGMNGGMMKKLIDKLRDRLDVVWEWIKVILLWLLIIGGIVLGSFFEHVVFVI